MSEKNSKPVSAASLLNDLPVITFERVKAPDGSYSYPFISEKGKDVLGLSSFDEFLSTDDGCPEITHCGDKKNLSEAIKKSAQTKSMSIETFRVILPEGQTKWLYGYAKPKKKKDGSIVWKGLWLDVTKDKQHGQIQSDLLTYINEGIVVFDRQGHILMATPALSRILHCETKDWKNETIFSLLNDSEAAESLRYFLLNSYGDHSKSFITTFHAEGYESISLEVSLSEAEDFYVAVFRDITEQRQKDMELHYLAYHDAVTGVRNTAYLKQIFPHILTQAKNTKTQIAVLSIAPDSVGQLNAVAGHAIGAKLLSELARRIQSCLSDQDILIRTSGYHFLALICDLEFNLEAEEKIEKILKISNKPLFVDELEFEVSLCIGVCFCPQDGEKMDDLIEHADLALEKARSDAKGSVRIYTGELSIPAVANMSMRKRLKQAIENEEIFPYFQPQIDINTGRIIGLEALARWKSSEGMIPPADFIPEAEEYGLIDALAEIILNQSCEWNQKWYAMGLCSIPVAVNISGRQFHNENQLLRLVENALDKSGLPPYLLELELTESSAMYDPKNAKRIIETLLENNIRCALDDFGTGYSSLSVLRSFPLKKLKIDRSFVLQLNDQKNVEIVRATIAMAHALNLSVLAEGVENKKHFEILKDLGCDIIQGYLFSRPLPAEEIEILLARWDTRLASTGKLL